MKLLIDGKYQKVGLFSFMKCNLIIELAISGMLVAGILLAKGLVIILK